MTIHAKINPMPSTPVVALHSSASYGSQWKKLARDLQGRFEVFAPDLPGYGSGELVMDPNHNCVGAIALPVICAILRNNCPVHLVGHSHGAAVALKIALMRPDLIKSLTLYEPATFHFLKHGNPGDRKLFQEINLISAVLTTAAATARPDLGMMRFIDFWNGEGAWERCPERHREIFASQATSIMSDFARGFSETWTLNDLRHLNIPTQMLMGDKSPAIAQRVTKLIANVIPGSDLKILPGFGHMAPATAPALPNLLVRNHILRVDNSSTNFTAEVLSAA